MARKSWRAMQTHCSNVTRRQAPTPMPSKPRRSTASSARSLDPTRTDAMS